MSDLINYLQRFFRALINESGSSMTRAANSSASNSFLRLKIFMMIESILLIGLNKRVKKMREQ